MKTEDIEYNGQVFTCRKIIDFSAMIELLSALAKKQEYLEKKIEFQDQRINDKDNRISELEIMIKGASQSKEEKFPSEKEIQKVKEKEKEKEKEKNKEEEEKDDDLNESDLDDYLDKIEKSEKSEEKENDEEKENEKSEPKDESKEKDDNEETKNKNEDDEEKNNNGGESEDKEKEKEKDTDSDKADKEENKEENGEKKEEEDNKKKSSNEDENKDTQKKSEKEEDKEKTKTEEAKEEKSNIKENDKSLEFSGNVTDKTKQKEASKENQTKSSGQKEKSGDKDDKDKDSTTETFKKIIKKLKILETKITNLEKNEGAKQYTKKTTTIGGGAGSKATDARINALNKRIDELNQKIKNLQDELEKVKVKAEDFNVYDIFKGGEGGDENGGNIDICKGLVMALENKVFKKFGFYDVKFKKNETDVYQCQNDIKNVNALINGINDRLKRMTNEMNEIKNTNDTRYVDMNKVIKEINEKINQLDEKINKNNKTNSTEHKELEDKIKELEQKMQQQNDNIDISKYVKDQGQMNPEDLKLLKDLSNRINEVEKFIKITFGKFNPQEINDRLDNLETEMVKKGNKYEINELADKLLYYDENEKDLNFKMDNLQIYNEKVRGDMQQIIKKIEYLSGELNRIANENSDGDKGKGPILDFTKIVDMNLFNEHKKEINKKFDKVRLSFEEIARNLDDILEKLSHTPSDTDFAQFQSIIKNMIEELKLNMNKKYADKSETNKSIKFLETQIKTIQESFTKKMEGADNWLLAKKPLNNYVCASCESIIRGELDKRSEYIPWNRYPNRDEKSYRMGHGFSRMLQMINEDKRKSQEMKEKDNMSDEERSRSDSEQNIVVNGSVKLPKLKHRYLNSGKKNNNSINNDEDNNNAPLDSNNPYDDADQIISADRPKIMKIYKKTTNRQVVQSSYLNRKEQIKNSDNLPNLVVKTVPNEVGVNQPNKSETIPRANDE